ncbi:MAG TPA: MarR family transcriptional regulator [Chloroflexota bacterium]|nr:MarR family transcriptional regulator [Chloroflexota bacterium]
MPPVWAVSTLTDEVASLVAAVFLRLEALDRSVLGALPRPVTTAQYHALMALAVTPNQSLGALARRLLCDKANASGLVDRMAAAGLVERLPDDTDRRRVVLRLTPDGYAILAAAVRARRDTLARVLGGQDDLHGAAAALRRLAARLENETHPVSEEEQQ